MPPLQKPCSVEGTTIICLLDKNNNKDEGEEDPKYYDIRYADYRDALLENDKNKIYYFQVCLPKYTFKLDFELPVNLSSLSLIDCKLKTFNVVLPKKLLRLNLSKNHLRKIPDDLPDSLTYLNVSKNNIRRVWKFPSKLEDFNCQDNNIEKIPNIFPETIKNINLSYNKIRVLPKEIPKSMKLMEINNNCITELPMSIANCQEIEVQWEENIVEELPVEISNVILTSINKPDYKNFIINKKI